MLNFVLKPETLAKDLWEAISNLEETPTREFVLLPTNENDPNLPTRPNARGRQRVDAAVAYAEEHGLSIMIAGGWYNPLGFSMGTTMAVDIMTRHSLKAAARIWRIFDKGVTTLQNLRALRNGSPSGPLILHMVTEEPHYKRMVPVANALKIELHHVPSGGDTGIYNEKDDASLKLNIEDPFGESSFAQGLAAQAMLDWQKTAINNFFLWWIKDAEAAKAHLDEMLPIFNAYVEFGRKNGFLCEDRQQREPQVIDLHRMCDGILAYQAAAKGVFADRFTV